MDPGRLAVFANSPPRPSPHCTSVLCLRYTKLYDILRKLSYLLRCFAQTFGGQPPGDYTNFYSLHYTKDCYANFCYANSYSLHYANSYSVDYTNLPKNLKNRHLRARRCGGEVLKIENGIAFRAARRGANYILNERGNEK